MKLSKHLPETYENRNEKSGFMKRKILSIYVIEMGIIKCEKGFAGIFIFSSLFKIKMKVFSHRTLWNVKILLFWSKTN